MTSSSSRTKRRKREAALNEDDQVEIWGRSLMDLPAPILMNILLKLPVKETLFCKSVCKTFNNLISNSESAKLHVSLAKTHTLIRAVDYPHVSRTLYLVELSDIHRQQPNTSDCPEFKTIKLDKRFKIPLRNSEAVLNKVDTDSTDNGVDAKRKCCIKVKPKDHKVNLVNSCNGLICLSEPSVNDPVMVCNPVTGEFINLPEVKTVKRDTTYTKTMDCGFGFDPVTNEFKVIRMYHTDVLSDERIRCPVSGKEHYSNRVTEVLSLGSGSWKNIGHAPSCSYNLSFPTYLNGSLHWLFFIDHVSQSWYDIGSSCVKVLIASFNFSAEQYQPLPLRHNKVRKDTFSLGTLQGCLCVCDSSSCEQLKIWVMKEYGVRESWTRKYSISLLSEGPYFPLGLYQPLHVSTNGGLLLFHPRKNALVYHGVEDRLFVVQGFKSKFEAIVHTPSFTSLKDVLKRKNVPVLNLNARCGPYKLFGETKSLYLEEDYSLSPDCSSDHESYSDS